MKRVKFFSTTDLAVGGYLNRVEKIILNFNENIEPSINDILELYNCTLYIDNKVFFSQWSDEHKEKLKARCKIIKGFIARYFSSINEMNIELLVETLHWQYKDDLLKLFVQYHLRERIDEKIFANILTKNIFSITQVCQQPQLVEYYEIVVKHSLLERPSNAELLFDKYIVDSRTNKKQLHFPKSLSKDEMNALITNYIDSTEANTSYLQLIINNHNTKEFSVTDEHRWKAKKRKESIERELFSNSLGVSFEYKFVFQKDAPELVQHKLDGKVLEIVYDQTYLEQELEFETILNNFIWIFEFIDSNGRINFVNNISTRTSILDVIQLKAKRDYPVNEAFKISETLSDASMALYYSFLKKKNVRLEDVLEWFFKVYLKEDFTVSDYVFTAPSKGSSYREKCRDILPEIEYVLQQFKCYVDYGEINHEMLALSSSGLPLNQVPSLIKNKYIYKKDILNPIFYHLFSDQTLLGYLENPGKDSATFYDLLVKHKVHIDEFKDYQRTELQYLIDSDYISINDGFLMWKNPARIKILYELYHYNVISMYRLSDMLQAEVKLMHQENLVVFESSLFSKSEQDMFDYYLNNSKFQNGPQLRNKYAHGRLGNAANSNEDINYKNYLLILKLLITIIIKINEDFCLYESKSLQN
ncbi:hypothetical protein [Lederbergia citrea]|uniref:hypothetical protein n=1 Tax=Lederbergia citrea TaxID=2833581 RepID=UPI001BC98698|nr:hypothetical protein [Lederbergia citrea]MBS4204315.1 hypothetical protein [Lederbergia citrea]